MGTRASRATGILGKGDIVNTVELRAQDILQLHPDHILVPAEDMAECIEACCVCARVTASCSDICLGDEEVRGLAPCIRTNLDCADMCETMARTLSRRTCMDWNVQAALLNATVTVLRACMAENECFATRFECCRMALDACRRAEEGCMRLVEEISVAL